MGAEATVNALHETLQNEEKFEVFIQWMYREFSSEAGLCFIEFVQFKEMLMKQIKTSNRASSDHIYALYGTIPQSSIIQQGKPLDDPENIKSVSHQLYDKYVKKDAEFEVNISYSLRAKYAKLDAEGWKIEMDELVNIFGKVIDEMFSFMRQSFERYQQSST